MFYHAELRKKKQPLKSYICGNERCRQWFSQWLVACSAPSHYQNQYCLIFKWALRINHEFWIKHATFQKCVCKWHPQSGGHFVQKSISLYLHNMSVNASNITGLWIVRWRFSLGWQERNNQNSALLTLCGGNPGVSRGLPAQESVASVYITNKCAHLPTSRSRRDGTSCFRPLQCRYWWRHRTSEAAGRVRWWGGSCCSCGRVDMTAQCPDDRRRGLEARGRWWRRAIRGRAWRSGDCSLRVITRQIRSESQRLTLKEIKWMGLINWSATRFLDISLTILNHVNR